MVLQVQSHAFLMVRVAALGYTFPLLVLFTGRRDSFDGALGNNNRQHWRDSCFSNARCVNNKRENPACVRSVPRETREKMEYYPLQVSRCLRLHCSGKRAVSSPRRDYRLRQSRRTLGYTLKRNSSVTSHQPFNDGCFKFHRSSYRRRFSFRPSRCHLSHLRRKPDFSPAHNSNNS